MKDYLLIGFILLMFVLYIVILPLFQRRQMKQQQAKMKAFQESLKVNDQVMLGAGIIGTIKAIHQETIELTIANNTTIDVDRLAVVGRMNQS